MVLFGRTGVGSLWRIPWTGSEPVAATQLKPSQVGHAFPQFLPDGRHFLYYALGTPETRGVYVGHLDEPGAAKRIVDAAAAAVFSPPNRVIFLRGGTLFAQSFDLARLEVEGDPVVVAEQVALGDRGRPVPAVSTADTGLVAYRVSAGAGETRYRWYDRSGNALGYVGEPNLVGATPALSPDQEEIAFPRRDEGNSDVWLLDIERGVRRRFVAHPALDSHPLWSPTGRQIVFQRFQNGAGDLYLKSTDSDRAEEFLFGNSRGNIPTDWSRDGKYVLYKQGSGTGASGWDIWALPMTGERKPFPVAQTPFEERDGQFSPDAKWVAYHSDESGQFEVYVQPFPSGRREQVSTAGGAQVHWRSDGKELFYVALDGSLMAVPIQLDSVKMTVRPGVPVRLFATRLAGGVLQAVSRQQYTPSLDGSRFLMHTVSGEPQSAPITVILNWRPKAQPTSPAP